MSRPTIDELEVLTPDQLGELLFAEVKRYPTDFQYIQDLLDVGCPINVRDMDVISPLHLAANWNNLELVRFLISKGADVNSGCYMGWRPWDMAHKSIKESVPELEPQ